jgi:hypothetical protein
LIEQRKEIREEGTFQSWNGTSIGSESSTQNLTALWSIGGKPVYALSADQSITEKRTILTFHILVKVVLINLNAFSKIHGLASN